VRSVAFDLARNYPLGTIDNYLIIHTTAIPLAVRVDIGEGNDSFTVHLQGTCRRSGNRLSFGSSCYMLVENRIGGLMTRAGKGGAVVGPGEVTCGRAREGISAYHVLS
jgi:hypothetical protein